MTWDSSIGSAGRPLRMLIVDDNHINLSVLSTLLKRRLGHLVEGAPVTVDSGLKAIQLLRTHVFDCIFMDIQMPFLSGLDATRRIRNGEDGVLAANSDAHIVAVTTAVGSEPELAYRRARMDGMIGKPVRFQSLQQYLYPLAQQAAISANCVAPIDIDGMQIMPPLPPASKYERVFYLPLDATVPATTPEICKEVDFEQLLHGQTRASLLQCGAMALQRPTQGPGASPNPQTRDDICTHHHHFRDVHHSMPSVVASGSDSSYGWEAMSEPLSGMSSYSSHRSAPLSTSTMDRVDPRNASMAINQKTFDKQLAREMANVDLQSSHYLSNHTSPRSIRRVQSRPQVAHRTSSPGWLLSEELSKQKSTLGLYGMVNSLPVHASRPKLVVLCAAETDQASSSSSFSVDRQSTPPLRRESQVSSSSLGSNTSSPVMTPSINEGSSFFWTNHQDEAIKAFGKEHQRLSSNSTVNPFSSSMDEFNREIEAKDSWRLSSEASCASSSPEKSSIWSSRHVSGRNDASATGEVSSSLREAEAPDLRQCAIKGEFQYDPSEDLHKLRLC